MKYALSLILFISGFAHADTALERQFKQRERETRDSPTTGVTVVFSVVKMKDCDW